MKILALYGAGDLGSEALELCKRCESKKSVYDEVVFVDDFLRASPCEGVRLLRFDELVLEASHNEVYAIICVGEPRVRRALAERLRQAGVDLATLVHPHAEVSSSAILEPGCIVYGGSYIGPSARIGANTLIIRGFVAHNCKVGANCVLNAHAALACHVSVGDQTFLSIGASVREGVSIGTRVIVGTGAAVFLNVEDDLYVVGNPARPMRRNQDQTVFRG